MCVAMPAKKRDHNLASAGIGHPEWLPIAHHLEQAAAPTMVRIQL